MLEVGRKPAKRILLWKSFFYDSDPLSPARWHGKHTYVSSLGMLGTTQLSFICRSHNILNGYEHTHTRQRMTIDNNNNNRKQV